MSTPLTVRMFVYGSAESEAFERVRAALPCYRGLPSEAAPTGLDCLLVSREQQPVARASLCVAAELHGVPGTSGLIGHFEAHDAAAAQALLVEARAVLAARGVQRVLAPMNGSTWGRYRLALPGEAAAAHTLHEPPPFLGEPVNPTEYAAWFEAAGFEVAARYESRIDEAPEVPAADAGELAERVKRAGIHVRTLDPGSFAAELRVLHELSLAAGEQVDARIRVLAAARRQRRG